MTPNQAAFLAMIRHSEGTDRAADPYRVVFGFALTLAGLRDHPAVTGEWMGVQTTYGHTSAAGAYQIEVRTWLECKAALRLADFTGTSQDDAALYLVKRRGALPAIEAGDLHAAIALCAPEWASLPGSTSGQPTARLAALIQAYSQAGGQLV